MAAAGQCAGGEQSGLAGHRDAGGLGEDQPEERAVTDLRGDRDQHQRLAVAGSSRRSQIDMSTMIDELGECDIGRRDRLRTTPRDAISLRCDSIRHGTTGDP
jgi:hypothetical protein